MVIKMLVNKYGNFLAQVASWKNSWLIYTMNSAQPHRYLVPTQQGKAIYVQPYLWIITG